MLRDGDRAVPKLLLRDFRMLATTEEMRGVGMARLVKRDAGQGRGCDRWAA
jgi:hypothetical protein